MRFAISGMRGTYLYGETPAHVSTQKMHKDRLRTWMHHSATALKLLYNFSWFREANAIYTCNIVQELAPSFRQAKVCRDVLMRLDRAPSGDEESLLGRSCVASKLAPLEAPPLDSHDCFFPNRVVSLLKCLSEKRLPASVWFVTMLPHWSSSNFAVCLHFVDKGRMVIFRRAFAA